MFNLDDDLLRQLRATFKIEAEEHLQAMNRALLALEQNPAEKERTALLAEIFREAHSLKGAAGAADFPEVEKTAHKLENVFGAAKAGKITLTRDLCDVLYAGIDTVGAIIEAALAEKPHGVDLATLYQRLDAAERGEVIPAPKLIAPSPGMPEPPPTPPSNDAVQVREIAESANKTYTGPERRKPNNFGITNDDTIRVATSKLDSLMARSGELMVAGLKIDQRLHEIEDIGRALEELYREWLKARASNNLHENNDALKPVLRLMDYYQERLRALAAQVHNLERGFAGDALHLARVINDLSEGVMKVRMLPVATVFDAFPRIVRDLARDSGKEVELRMAGGETELDRKVLEEIKDPLIHLIRNAVDHGIEKPDVRVQAGKPAQGTIDLRAYQKGNSIVIEMTDDGAGIQRDKVKQAAIKNGIITAEQAQALSDDEALQLIFAPGLSTSSMITNTSGRGVGMDVVRKNIEALQGQVEVETMLGRGTTIALTLPLTLATTQILLVQVGEQTFGIPISAVERILRINPKEIVSVTGRRAIVVDEEPVSLALLSEVLELQNVESQIGADGKMPVVILSSAKKRVAFLVDNIVGQQESVVKSLGKQLARVRNIGGATILGSGKIVMTLNPTDLFKSVRSAPNRIAALPHSPTAAPVGKAKKQRARILVVDDSLSTRTLEKNILETAGYQVTIATDGIEALNLLRSNGGFDLVVSDVLMPRMDGLQLTANVKRDPSLKRLPVVLMTSLDSQADKERGLEVGADAYLVKSNFDQSNLLETVSQLI
jgi:two-component system chemotaxis sensor kinase CheA